MRKLSARLALASAVALLATAGFATNASASFPVLHTGAGDMAHTCNVVGVAVRGYEAVVCSDLFTGNDGSGFSQVWGQVEAYCQTIEGVVVQCANIKLTENIIVNTGTIPAGEGTEYICGHDDGPCPSGRFIPPPTTVSNISSSLGWNSSSCITNPSYNMWNLAWGGSRQITVIELPVSDANEVLESPYANDGDNESSGHYDICP